MKLNRSALESVLVLGIMFGVVWGVRVLFITYVSQHWIGTFGVTSGILGTITILSWYDRLGWFGRAYKKAFTGKIMKKLTKLRIITAVLTLYFFGVMSLGAHMGMQYYSEQSAQVLDMIEAETGGDVTVNTIIQNTEQKITENPIDYTASFGMMALYIVLSPFIDNTNWMIMFGTAAQVFPLFFYYVDIIFIEEIEVLGVMVLWSRLQRKASHAKEDHIKP